MKVAIIQRKNDHAINWLQAFCDGLVQHGIRPEIVARGQIPQCDLAVFWSHRVKEVIQRQRTTGRDYLVMENAFLDRGKFVSLGFNGLNGESDIPFELVDDQRWKKHFPDRLKEWRSGLGVFWGLVGQVPGDESIKGHDQVAWAEKWMEDFPHEDWRYRPHPLGSPAIPMPHHTGTLQDFLDEARMVVTWSSTVGVDAIVNGTQCAVDSPVSIAYKFAIGKGFSEWDRTDFVNELAYRQWTIEELRSGEAWEFLRHNYE